MWIMALTWAMVCLVGIIVVVSVWRFLHWVWFDPIRMEKMLRAQGFKGNPYTFLYGDAKEMAIFYKRSYSKPIPPDNNIMPRVLPFVTNTIKTYGSKSFMWIGPRPQVFIRDPELMKEVLIKYTTYQKAFRISTPIVKSLVKGLLRYEGHEWVKSRKKLNPAFHLEKLKLMVPSSQFCSEKILNKWKEMIAEDRCGVVNIAPHLEDFAGSSTAKSLFSADYDVRKKIFHLVTELSVLSNQAQPFSFPGQKYLPTKKNRRAKEIEEEIRATLVGEIDKRLLKRKLQANECSDDQDHVPLDLFDRFMEGLHEEEDIKIRQQIIDEVIGQSKLFHLAGFETTSNLLIWTIIVLCMNPQWQARAREEVFQVLGDKTQLCYEDMSRLKLMPMIFYEVLRLYPPVVELTRIVEEDTKLGEYKLPKGSLVMLPILLMNRDPEIWGPDVNEFRPERFAEGALKAAANGQAAFMPFGWGARACIGQNFSQLSAKVFMSQLLRTFTFELGPNYEHAPWVVFTMRPQFGAPIMLRKL